MYSMSLWRILIFEIETIFSLIHLDRWYRRRRGERERAKVSVCLSLKRGEERKSFLISSKIHSAHGKSTFKTMKICCAHTYKSPLPLSGIKEWVSKQRRRDSRLLKSILLFEILITLMKPIMGELKNWNSPTNVGEAATANNAPSVCS
jgi:hypothetical protein